MFFNKPLEAVLTLDQKIVISKVAKQTQRDRSADRPKSPAVVHHSLTPTPQNFVAPPTKIVTSDILAHEHPAAAKLHRLSAQSRDKLTRSMAPREDNSPPGSVERRRTAEERSPNQEAHRNRSKSPTSEDIYEVLDVNHLPGSKVPSRKSKESVEVLEVSPAPAREVKSRPISRIADSFEAVPAASDRFDIRSSRDYAQGRLRLRQPNQDHSMLKTKKKSKSSKRSQTTTWKTYKKHT